jgi:hypothetical protein
VGGCDAHERYGHADRDINQVLERCCGSASGTSIGFPSLGSRQELGYLIFSLDPVYLNFKTPLNDMYPSMLYFPCSLNCSFVFLNIPSFTLKDA